MIQIIAQEPLLQLAALLAVFAYAGSFGILFFVRYSERHKKR